MDCGENEEVFVCIYLNIPVAVDWAVSSDVRWGRDCNRLKASAPACGYTPAPQSTLHLCGEADDNDNDKNHNGIVIIRTKKRMENDE